MKDYAHDRVMIGAKGVNAVLRLLGDVSIDDNCKTLQGSQKSQEASGALALAGASLALALVKTGRDAMRDERCDVQCPPNLVPVFGIAGQWEELLEETWEVNHDYLENLKRMADGGRNKGTKRGGEG